MVATPAPTPLRGALASRCCALWRRRKGFPGGGAFRHCRERLSSGASPPPVARPLGGLPGPATHVLGAGVQVWEPSTVCLARMPRVRLRVAGWCWPSPGGLAFHRCEVCLVSGPVPPPSALPQGRAAGVPRPVCPGCRWCGCGDPAPAAHRAPLRAVVARCGGGGRAFWGGMAFDSCERRLVSGAVPPPNPVLRDARLGSRDPCVLGAVGVGVGALHRPQALRAIDARRGDGGRASLGGCRSLL